MAQVKVYGLRGHLDEVRDSLSDAIHSCVMEALDYPAEKRVHRFLPVEAGDFRYPPDRTDQYTIIEISMFEGRSVEAKKRLLRLLFERIGERCGIRPVDVEVTIFETPRHNWGIRGVTGDELDLDYRVDV